MLHPVGGQSLTKSHICVALSGTVCERNSLRTITFVHCHHHPNLHILSDLGDPSLSS